MIFPGYRDGGVMPPKSRASAVFIHGLAKKPAPEKLKEIWLWGLSRDNPMPNVFPPPNQGVDLVNVLGVPQFFNYYADVYYGTDYEVDLDSYYELLESEELQAEHLDRIELEIPWPHPVTPREKRFVRNVDLKLKANPAMLASAAMAEAGQPAK